MNLSVELILLLMASLGVLIVFLVGMIIVNKLSTIEETYQRNYRRLATILSIVGAKVGDRIYNIREIKEIKQCLLIDDIEEQLHSSEYHRLEAEEIRKLRSRSTTRRKEAVTYLGLLESKRSRAALEDALREEKDYSVKIYIVSALADMNHPDSVIPIIESLYGAHKWYRERAISNLLDFGSFVLDHFEVLKESRHIEVIELLVRFASVNISQPLKIYVKGIIDNSDRYLQEMRDTIAASENANKKYKVKYLEDDFNKVLDEACSVMADYYYEDFSSSRYYNDPRAVVRRYAYIALASRRTTQAFKILLERLEEHETRESAVIAINRMTEMNPRFLYLVEDEFDVTKKDDVRAALAQALSNRIEYYIMRLGTDHQERSVKVLEEILRQGRVSELIGFLNRNKDIEIENQLVDVIIRIVEAGSRIETEMRTYLNPRVLSKCGLTQEVIEPARHSGERDRHLAKVVAAFTLITLLAFPAIHLIRHDDLVAKATVWINLRQYVIDFNYYLAYYSTAINLTYMALLLLAFKNLKKQSKLWNIKSLTMMFRKRMLPSISIIAPAYNEEKTIVSSASSLLNLKYPDYEVVIVNDGSSDETLHTLIDAFELIRVDHTYDAKLPTAPVRGVYKNPSLPKLIVVDKNNGGKADSLNAGINISTNEYFCGIDADSLLEEEALLRIASLTLDESVETPAIGGNIFPINGCTVEKGHITAIGLPKSHLARFETMEYIRAFMAGRLGWEYFNSLLIISGAFGLFRKDRIVGTGGYLTSKGRYKKDTVGEDMELVVRVTRLLHELKQPSKIAYAFNANCWTEVPEDMRSLRTQRYRWHRGLIDILYFHRQMMFNPKYGSIGMVSLPYFFIFEALGPMIEIQGYIMVVLAAMMGILDQRIAILLFMTTILLGVMTSLMSLLIAEKDSNYFKGADTARLILYAVLENFGPRQLISFWRIVGQIKVITGGQGWGTIKRKGI